MRGWGAAAVLAAALVGCDGGAGGDVITPDDLEGVFVRRSACDGTALTPALASILANATGSAAAASAELACGRGASTCEDFLACRGVDPAEDCDPATFAPVCDGAVRVTCESSGRVRREDCARDDDGNGTCRVDAIGVPRCAVGPCDAAGLRCEANAIVTCTGDVERRTEDCSLSDQTCAVNAAGDRAACVDRVASCSADACDGDVLLACSEELGQREVRCPDRTIGGTCASVDGEAACTTDATECTDGAAECAGAVARFCVDGAWVELDCARFLDGTCVDESEPDRPALRCVVE